MNTFPVEILTGHFQISGDLEVRGNPSVYVNDASFDVFAVHKATMTPLAPGTSVGPVKVPLLYVPKTEPHVMLVGNLEPKDAQLLPNKINLVAFTDTYVIKANFHAGPETKADDVLFYATGPYFPATEAEIYAMRPLTADLGGQADLVFVHRNHVRTFYPG
jgi:hypothetical protein